MNQNTALYQLGGVSRQVDPSKIPVETLRLIHGDMWPAIGSPGQWGPHPGSPTNIMAMDYYEWYSVEERSEMRRSYKSYGWVHAVTGPMVDPGGYHGMYPQQPTVPTQAQWDHYLGTMQEWWDDGLIPVHFIHPDNWSLEQMDALEHLYRQPRALKLLRIIVPTGWEPTRYDWKAAYWAAIIRKVRGWFSDAPAPTLFYIHTVTDTDAPTGNGDDHGYDLRECAAIMSMSLDEMCDHLRVPRGTTHLEPSNGTAWDFCLPYLHGWLIQNGPYYTAPAADPQLAKNFGDQFDPKASDAHSIAWHWALPNGNAGWHPRSAWGLNIPPDLIAAEQTAYAKFWEDFPEADAIKWGRLALSRGAAGALDGV